MRYWLLTIYANGEFSNVHWQGSLTGYLDLYKHQPIIASREISGDEYLWCKDNL